MANIASEFKVLVEKVGKCLMDIKRFEGSPRGEPSIRYINLGKGLSEINLLQYHSKGDKNAAFFT